MAKKEGAEFTITPKSGDADTVFDLRGRGYEPGKVLSIDLGKGVSTSVVVSEDGNWHLNTTFPEGDHDVTTKYVGDEEPQDEVQVKVS